MFVCFSKVSNNSWELCDKWIMSRGDGPFAKTYFNVEEALEAKAWIKSSVS